MKRAFLILVAALAVTATAQERVPGADQHVTVPGAPGQANKELLVQPSDAQKQGKYGWVLQGERAANPGIAGAAARTQGVGAQPELASRGNSSYVPGPSGPTGPAVVDAAYVSVRGTVTSFTKNAITVLEKSGRQRQVSLAPTAVVYQGLKAGDEVVLRIPFNEGADCHTADRVEHPPAPKEAPKSKFSQATGG
jgi:hypothetical protein